MGFKENFYNLDGVHLNERKMNFNKLLKSTDLEQLEKELDFEPRNHLERVFFMDILIHLKKTDTIAENLKHEHPILISKILKHNWFFEELAKNMNEEYMVNEYLPQFSYSLRMKMLKKFGDVLNEDRMDKIFDNLQNRYGIYVAKQFLTYCSSDKITTTLHSNFINLSNSQLKKLLDKDYQLVKIYFDEYKKDSGHNFKGYKFLSYIPWKYPNLFAEFLPYFNTDIKLGRNTTKAVLKIDKELITKNVNTIIEICNLNVVTRKIENFDKTFLPQLIFPKTRKGIDFNCRQINPYLKKYPAKRRWNILAEAFFQAYNLNIVDKLEEVPWPVHNHMSFDIRQQWAEIQFKKDKDEFSYVEYLKFSESFVLMKERINVSNYDSRLKILESLLDNCNYHDDYKAYEQVIKYILFRHKNEHTHFRNHLLDKLGRTLDIDKTTEDIWKYINDLVEVARIKKEELPKDLCGKYLLYLWKNQLPMEQALEMAITEFSLHYFSRYCFKPDIQRMFMQRLVKIITTLETKGICRGVELFMIIVNHNCNNPDQWIDMEESTYMVELITKELTISSDDTGDLYENVLRYNYSDGCPKIITAWENVLADRSIDPKKFPSNILSLVKYPKSPYQNTVLNYIMENCHSVFDKFKMEELTVDWLKNKPDMIVKYFDNIVQFNVLKLDYSLIKFYSHLLIDRKLVEYAKKLITPESDCLHKEEVIIKLADLMDTDEFIELIHRYIPTTSKLDLQDEDQKSVFRFQCLIADALKRVMETQKVLTILPSFCQGDYLNDSLSLLYKMAYHINEQSNIGIIERLHALKAMSAKKQSGHLGFNLLPRSNIMVLFEALAKDETNVSAKKHLFLGLLRYYQRNPYDHIFELVEKHVRFIDHNDDLLIIRFIRSLEKIQLIRKVDWANMIFNFLDILLTEKEIDVDKYKQKTIFVMNSLGNEFFKNVNFKLANNILANWVPKRFPQNVEKFVVQYLTAHCESSRFDLIFKKLQENIDWNAPNFHNYLKTVFAFFDRTYKTLPNISDEFFNLFKLYWEQLLPPPEGLLSHVMLGLMEIYRKNRELDYFCEKLNQFFKTYTMKYGPYITDMLIKSLNNFLRADFARIDKWTYENIVLKLLNTEASNLNCYMALKIRFDLDDDEGKIMYEQVESCLERNGSPAHILCLRMSITHS